MASPDTIVLILGVFLGTTIAGIVANAMNDLLDASGDFRRLSLAAYIFVPTIGLAPEYGHPVIIGITAFVGVVVVGRLISKRLLSSHDELEWVDEDDQE